MQAIIGTWFDMNMSGNVHFMQGLPETLYLIDGFLSVHSLHSLQLHLLQCKYPPIRCLMVEYKE